MPIYEYRCAACGFQKEYLQKMSAAPLTECPECGKPSFSQNGDRCRLSSERQRLVRDRF